MYHPASTTPEMPGRENDAIGQRAFSDVIALVAQRNRVARHLFIHRSRGCRAAARARQLAMYLSHVICGRTLSEIGERFGRDRTTVSYACAVIEDLRDDPAFDAEVTALERELEARLTRSARDA
jgi:chromosomal replication initiation ATPase DnaA